MCVAFIVSVRGLCERHQLGVVGVGLLTEWVWKILKTHQKHEQTVGPLTCPLGKRWLSYGKWTRRLVRKMRAMANHHANPREQCSQMEAPDGNNKRNTRTISFIFVFGFAVGRKYSVASTRDT